MADTFCVLQYWFIDKNDSTVSTSINDPDINSSSSVYIGLYLHFVKSTSFKSQIISGTKTELALTCNKWMEYLNATCRKYIGSTYNDKLHFLYTCTLF